jgi:PKD repeat protein
MKSIFTLLLLAALSFASFGSTQRYRLMFNDDPATTVTIGWEQVSGSNPIVYYGTTNGGLNSGSYSNSIAPYKTTNYMGMTNKFAKITGLTPNTAYYFIIEDSEGISQPMVYYFKTCPDDNNEPLSFVSGGDSRSGQTQRQNSNKMVAKIRPHAVLFGGDLVNTPSASNGGSTQTWFDDWQYSIASDGQMFPMVHSFGNHEDYGDGGPEFISELFDTPYDVYYNVKFGGDLFSMYTLNGEVLPGHTISNGTVRAAQTSWLGTSLAADNSIWKAAQYHRPIVPHHSSKGEGADEFNDWAWNFYNYDVRLVMESDAHVTKITEEVRPAMGTASGSSSNWFTSTSVPSGKGITFTGEGAWGTIRVPDDTHPFTTAATSMYHFTWIIVDKCKIELRTIDTQSPNTVPEHDPNDIFSVSPGLDAQIWKPSGLPSGVRVINKEDNLPDVDFIADNTNIFEGQTVNFTDLSTNSPTAWDWTFGDGNTSTVQNPANVYANAGTYAVTLEATNGNGTCSDKKTDYINVAVPSPPVADFVADDVTPNVSQVVNFTDLTTNNPNAWSWDFGDGNVSTQQNPTNTYTAPGIYTVTLTATNTFGNDTETKTSYIDVQTGGSVIVQVTGTNNDAEEDTEINVGDMYLTSSDLEIGNDGGQEQIVGIRFTGINVPQGATISNAYIRFMCDEPDGAGSQMNIYFAGHDIDNAPIFSSTNFDITSRTQTAAQVTWADGTVPAWVVGTTYDSPDISAIVQEIVDRPGWNSGNAMAFMIWSDPGETSERVSESYDGTYGPELIFDWSVPSAPAPVAAFSSNLTTLCAGSTVDFTDNSTNTPTSWLWDFGDGNTSTSQNPTHTYANSGNYTVTLTATNSGGSDSETQSNLITVNALPNVNASTNQSICEGDNATISATGADSYSWDNSLGTGSSHSVSPTTTTVYTVTGTSNGCNNTDQVTIAVTAIPTTTASTNQTICEGDNVTITASGNATNYSWDNGLGTGTSHSVSPSATTTYTVTGDTDGCTSSDQVVITVNPLPSVAAAGGSTICEGDNVTISASGATSYVWDNGIGAGVSHSVSPTSTTTYTVTGTENGCDNTDQVTINVDTQSDPGTPSAISVCFSNNSVDMFGALTGEDNGGTWSDDDATGQLSGNTLDATGLTVGSTYNFTYSFAANGACPDVQTTTQVTVSGTVDAGTATANDNICSDDNNFDLFNTITAYTPGGTWNDDNATGQLSGNTVDGTGLSAGTYDFTYTINGGACGTDSETISVTVNNVPVVISSGDQAICEGETVTISASGAVSYDWDNSLGAGASHSINPTTSTTYTVTGSDNGCEATDQLTITVNPIPSVSMDPFKSDTICITDEDYLVELPTTSPNGGAYNGTGVVSNQFFDPSAAGVGTHTITYNYTDNNGCSNSASQDIVVIDDCFVAVDENDLPIFSIYPNPARDFITIERENPSEFSKIRIYDMHGKLVYDNTVTDNPVEIAVDEWSRGTYTVQFSNKNDKKINRRIIIQ